MARRSVWAPALPAPSLHWPSSNELPKSENTVVIFVSYTVYIYRK